MDITMTAVRRPDVIEKTLKSFTENLFVIPEDHRLIVNIDPVGDEETNESTINIIKKYFPKYIVFSPDKPSFPKAVISVWNEVESKYFFHLEDDWILEKPLFLSELIKPLDTHNNIASVRLYKEKIPNNRQPTMFGCKYNYHDNYNYFNPIPGSNNWKNQFGLNPVLIRKQFIDESLPLMEDNKNPEKQFRENNPKMRNILNKWTFSVYGYPGMKRTVWGKNGLHWRLNSKFKKPRDGSSFTTWALRE